jgi:uncharacterized protein YbaP (TraB family)
MTGPTVVASVMPSHHRGPVQGSQPCGLPSTRRERGGTTGARLVALLLLLACLGLLTLRATAASPSFLWRVTGPRGGTVFVAGSIHLLSSQYYPLAPAFDEAFTKSDLLVEELDMGEMLAPESQVLMLRRGMAPSGQTLDKVLSPAAMAAVTRKATELGLPVAPLQLFKPWALALTLQGLEFQKAGFDAELGLDRHFYDRARAAGKQVQGLETLAFQISRFDELPMPLQERLLEDTLKEMETARANLDTLVGAWKNGDAAAIERLVLSDLKDEPEMYDRLLVQRNRMWMPTIEGLFTRTTPAFVIVGAAHLVGSDGLLAMLRARGYTVTQM